MKRAGLVGAALCVGAAAWAAGKPAATATAKKEVGNLVIDGIPDVPPAIGERLLQYQNVRAAALLDWSPDGKGLLIATRFGQTAQVHFVAAAGADRQQLTFYDEPIQSAFFDDAKGPAAGFYFSRDVGGAERYQLYWFDRKTGKATLLTDGTSRNEGFVEARAGGSIAFSSTARNNTDFDIYVMDAGAAPKLVKEVQGQWNAIDWSADGKTLLLKHEVSITESTLWTLDPATGTTTQVNALADGKKVIAYGGAVLAPKGDVVYYASDEDSEFLRLVKHDLKTNKKTVLTPDLKWDVASIALSRDGKQLAYAVNEGGRSALYLATTAAPTKARRVTLPTGVVDGLAFDRAGKRLGVTMSAYAGGDVYVVDVGSAKVTQWTFSEVGGLDRASFVEPELVTYASFDKMQIPAWVYKPRGLAAGKKVPVVVSIHGGPEGQAQPHFNAFNQYLVNELGVAVIEPNVRGSTGYGKTYVSLDNGFGREGSVKDIGGLLDWIATQPDLDASRVAVYGGSYGGFMVLASMVMFNDRIKCGVDIVGISHFVTFLQNTEDYRRDLRRVEYGDERDPKMREFQDKISPRTNAAKIKAPLFVVQGANDPRVPASEAEQIVKTVRGAGGLVWYLLAKDEGHGFRKKPNRDYMSAAVSLFLQTYLLP
jgi:dipeptidyl aminopeptidase/acylaminoacyl peptidase